MNAEPRTILCFGDSNTHGTMAMSAPGDLGRYPRGTRWPDVLAAELGAAYAVIAEGHPGRTTVLDDPLEGEYKSGLRALPVLLESHRPIELVVVMLGTNDLKARFALPPSDIAIGVERLLEVIGTSTAGPGGRAPRALVVAPAPIVETGFLGAMFAGGAARSHRLAAELADVAARRDAGFCDAGQFGEVDPGDGIHLTAAAHEAIGKALAAAIGKLFGEI